MRIKVKMYLLYCHTYVHGHTYIHAHITYNSPIICGKFL